MYNQVSKMRAHRGQPPPPGRAQAQGRCARGAGTHAAGAGGGQAGCGRAGPRWHPSPARHSPAALAHCPQRAEPRGPSKPKPGTKACRRRNTAAFPCTDARARAEPAARQSDPHWLLDGGHRRHGARGRPAGWGPAAGAGWWSRTNGACAHGNVAGLRVEARC